MFPIATAGLMLVASGTALALVRDCKASQDYRFGSKGSDILRDLPGRTSCSVSRVTTP